MDAVTIEAIRARSGVSVGSLYHHFGDKQGVFTALFVAGVEHFGEIAMAAMARGDSAEAGLRALVGDYLEWIVAHPDWARFLLTARPRLESLAGPQLRDANGRYFTALSHWLNRWPETRPWPAAPPWCWPWYSARWTTWPALARRLDARQPLEHRDALADGVVSALLGH
ncbi:TetR/AcrR family transcriptional regulator [Alcanivorax sp. IO_7]|nr:TetR/AcrR family transcriptional regulator [Alcanivorax sp. IO_7]